MSDVLTKYWKMLESYSENSLAKDLDYSIHVSLKYNYIFFEIPKVACSTIKLTLQRMEFEEPNFSRLNFEDLHDRRLSPLLKLHQLPDAESYLKKSNFLKFCFVRNPYERFLSCYLDKICHPTVFKKRLLEYLEGREVADRYISFEEFVEAVESQHPKEMDNHWRPQYYLSCSGEIDFDFVGRLENFYSDFYAIGSQINSQFSEYYGVENRHKTNSNSYMNSYYTSSLYSKVFDIFEIDFDKFGYHA